ncbi:SDR family NAD(P)-dependent oxidoreductase [Novosphingobium malaysiense]|uniref:2-deoxy-D-gluconate 3-dehydrogenase n=1 Tax=Novosphingobium malaysiense TaxID=1348853 RepID=A0A0B1ZFG3_9SPHN|nr:SDR family oxidoreductase [Novosphingobium malaysiense]KHK89811.1 hypothetical protein LK12_17975 [Novosphingobium malaysiense]
MAKRALITGGAHPMGIGFATARALVRDGFEVTVTGLTEAEIALTPEVPGIDTVVLDVSDGEAVKELVSGFRTLDALVNCAGTATPREFDPEVFARTLDVNVTGSMRTAVAARPLLAASKGAVVNIASIYAYFGSAVVPGYSASKGGVVQLTKALAAAWGQDGIRVNAIAPGFIKTDMARETWENADYAAAIVARTPLARFGDPAECADVIAFLCGPGARFVNGVTLPVDGGYLVTG